MNRFLLVDLTSLSDVISVFEEHQTIDSRTMNLDKYIDVSEILIYLKAIFDKTANEYPQMINVVSTIDFALNWLLNIYDLYASNSNMCFSHLNVVLIDFLEIELDRYV